MRVRRIRFESLEDRATPAGLIAAYSFDEGSGSKVADASGNGNSGVLANAVWKTAGKFGGALSFNGTNAKVSISDSASLDLTTAMTLEAWINPTALASYRTVIIKESAPDLVYALYASNQSSRPVSDIRQGSTYYTATGPAQLPVNTWTHLASTYDGASLRLYVNGTLVSTVARAGSINVSAGALSIGGNSIWGEWFSGLIDDVRIYNVALTASQVAADMNSPVRGPDTTPPTVTSVVPAAGATGVATLANVTVTLSEAMDLATVNASTLELRDPNNTLVPAVVTYDASTRRATLDPTGTLALATTYTLLVHGGATDPRVKDLAGNALAANYSTSFTTALPTLAISNVSVVEGNSGTVNASFTVNLSAAIAQTVTVTASTADGTATAGRDYTALAPAVLTFAPGQTTKTVLVSVIGDTVLESNETFLVNLKSPSNASLANSQGLGTIADDDAVVIGSEAFGYSAFTYPVEAIDLVPGASGVTTILATGNDNSTTITLPTGSTFNFYGTSYTSLIASTNGLITFASANTSGVNTNLTSVPTQRSIAPLWDDWINTSSNAMLLQKYEDTNADGINDRLIVEWNNVQGAPTSPSPVTFQAILQLNTGAKPGQIIFNYPDLDAGNSISNGVSATVGIKDTGTPGLRRLLVSFNTASPYVGSGKAIRISPDLTPPTVVLTAPGDGAIVSGTVNVTANAADNIGVAGVQFLLDGANLGAEDTTAPYSVAWNTATAMRGAHIITAKVRDTSSNLTTSAARAITVVPKLVITAPANNATLTSTTLNVTYTTSGDMTGIDHVHFVLDSSAEVADTSIDGSFQLTGVTAGAHVITGYLLHGAETQSGDGPFNFTVVLPDLEAPQAAITFPAAGAQIGGIVTVAASASDNIGVVGVQFFVDGAAVGLQDAEAPYGVDWDTRTASNGTHILTAKARDATGNVATSSEVVINVSNANHFQNEILVTGLDLPTNIEFLPDGRMLIAELAGTIKLLQSGATQVDPQPFLQLTNVGSAGVQQGIMDVVLDPDFSNNKYYYVFYTAGTPNRDRLSRFTANASATATVAGSELVLYQDPQDANAEHHGGALNFGNDGKLYFTTGEHFDPPSAQSLSSPRGKIHRINKDGSIPTDNPFYDGPGPNVDSIWAYGLRNPFRAFYDAPTGRFYVADVGGNSNSVAKEEVNLGVAGANYGWPNSEGPTSPPNTSPIYYYPHNGRDAAITGGFVYHGTQFPSSYQGSYFFADYAQNWIRRLTFDANGAVSGVFNFEPIDGSLDGPYGDIVYLTEGPDGALYYVDLGYSDIGGTFGVSKIRRIRYTATNQPPTAVAAATPNQGPTPLTVTFSSAGSVDPEGQLLSYQWTFGDNTTSTEASPTHVYNQAGQYTVRLSVSDGVNSTQASPLFVSAGEKPTATILTPQSGSFFRAGDLITFSGEGTDLKDGVLPPSAFAWSIDFLHEGHVHPGVPQTGVKSGSFSIPTSGHDFSGNTRYRITLTVTDSDGLQTSQAVLIYPEKVNLTFDTVPPGLTLNLDGIARTTPLVYDTLVGFTHTVEAPAQLNGGSSYTFGSWSDGGTQSHNILAPSVNQGFSATFQAAQVSGPVASYAFNEGSGGSATDLSGNGNTGTISGAAWTTAGQYGQALAFNGTGAYVDVGNAASLQLTGSMTISAWINSAAFPADDAAIVSKRGATENGFQLDTTVDKGPRTIGFKLTNASGDLMARYGSTTLVANQWYYVTGVYNAAAQTMDVYLNGVLDNGALVGTVTSTQQNSTAPVAIGKRSGASGFAFNGRIDEVRVYNQALSQAQIQAAMNTPIGSPLHLGGEEIRQSDAAPLIPGEVRPLLNAAIAIWQNKLGDSPDFRQLRGIRLEVLDLPGTLLGLASSSVVYLDSNAAGHGWFIDQTPWGDSEFVSTIENSPAQGRVDLLTVLTHELGHLLGLDDDHLADPFTGNVMVDTLAVGVRRIELGDGEHEAQFAGSIPKAIPPAYVHRRSANPEPRVRGVDDLFTQLGQEDEFMPLVRRRRLYT